MLLPIVATVIIAGALLVNRNANAALKDHEIVGDDFPHVPPENDYGLPDVHPLNQKGNYSRQYDDAYLASATRSRIPFALLKAHAIRESGQNPNAFRREPETTKRPESASYGLLQPLWWKGSNRLKFAGYPDSQLGDGSVLFEPGVNAAVGAEFIRDNLDRLELRDAINAYNTGVAESVRSAPGNYVNDVLKYYSNLIGRGVL